MFGTTCLLSVPTCSYMPYHIFLSSHCSAIFHDIHSTRRSIIISFKFLHFSPLKSPFLGWLGHDLHKIHFPSIALHQASFWPFCAQSCIIERFRQIKLHDEPTSSTHCIDRLPENILMVFCPPPPLPLWLFYVMISLPRVKMMMMSKDCFTPRHKKAVTWITRELLFMWLTASNAQLWPEY